MTKREEAAYELRRHGFHVDADKAETAWANGQKYLLQAWCTNKLRTVKTLVEQANHET